MTPPIRGDDVREQPPSSWRASAVEPHRPSHCCAPPTIRWQLSWAPGGTLKSPAVPRHLPGAARRVLEAAALFASPRLSCRHMPHRREAGVAGIIRTCKDWGCTVFQRALAGVRGVRTRKKHPALWGGTREGRNHSSLLKIRPTSEWRRRSVNMHETPVIDIGRVLSEPAVPELQSLVRTVRSGHVRRAKRAQGHSRVR